MNVSWVWVNIPRARPVHPGRFFADRNYRGTSYHLSVTEAAKVLLITTPAGMERFLTEVGSSSGGASDAPPLSAIAQKHGIELLDT